MIISNDAEFFKFLEEMAGDPYLVFRGHGSNLYELIPKIGRHKVTMN